MDIFYSICFAHEILNTYWTESPRGIEYELDENAQATGWYRDLQDSSRELNFITQHQRPSGFYHFHRVGSCGCEKCKAARGVPISAQEISHAA